MLQAVLGILFGIPIGAAGATVALTGRLDARGWRTAGYAAFLAIISFSVAFYLLKLN